MWFFKSPEFVFGDESLCYLEQLEGKRAFIVTDAVIARLGHVACVQAALQAAGFQVGVFDRVEPYPSLDTVRAGAAVMAEFNPDWIVGLGGGSCLDAAKAMWVLYERPDMTPESISPMEKLNLRRKARL